jgi:hypothetical protein
MTRDHRKLVSLNQNYVEIPVLFSPKVYHLSLIAQTKRDCFSASRKIRLQTCSFMPFHWRCSSVSNYRNGYVRRKQSRLGIPITGATVRYAADSNNQSFSRRLGNQGNWMSRAYRTLLNYSVGIYTSASLLWTIQHNVQSKSNDFVPDYVPTDKAVRDGGLVDIDEPAHLSKILLQSQRHWTRSLTRGYHTDSMSSEGTG